MLVWLSITSLSKLYWLNSPPTDVFGETEVSIPAP
jgi:hypothetical protein